MARGYWLLEMDVDGRVLRWSTEAVAVPKQTGLLLDYRPGLDSDLQISQGDEPGIGITDDTDWPTLAPLLEGTHVRLLRWNSATIYEQAEVYSEGRVTGLSHGAKYEKVEFSISLYSADQSYDLGSQVPAATASVNEATWDVVTGDGSGDTGGTGGGAPTTSKYLVLDYDATLTQERKFQVGSGLADADAGAGSTYTVGLGTNLLNFHNVSSTGVLVVTGNSPNTYATRTLTAGTGVSVSNGDGVSGNPTISVSTSLQNFNAVAATGILVVTANSPNTYAVRTLVAPAAGLSWTDANGVAGNMTIALANDLGAVEGLSGTGVTRRTGVDAWDTIGEIDLVTTYYIAPWFGYKMQGNLTLGGTTTLTGPVDADTFDLAGNVCNTDGYQIRCRQLKDSVGGGIIQHNGTSAGARPGQQGATATQYCGGGSNGGSGGLNTANGSNGTNRSNSFGTTIFDAGWSGPSANVGNGGNGGSSGAGNAGGTGGTATSLNLSAGNNYFQGTLFIEGQLSASGSMSRVHGGAGGAGGGSTGSNAFGGGGGGGAGFVWIAAHTLHTSASGITLKALGGNGAAGSVTTGTGAGGGGGGGGGGIELVYAIAQGSLPSTDVSGGTGGAGAGTGVAGSNGQAGYAKIIRVGT